MSGYTRTIIIDQDGNSRGFQAYTGNENNGMQNSQYADVYVVPDNGPSHLQGM